MNTIKTIALATAALGASVTGATASESGLFGLSFFGGKDKMSKGAEVTRQYQTQAQRGPRFTPSRAVSNETAGVDLAYRTQAQRGPRFNPMRDVTNEAAAVDTEELSKGTQVSRAYRTQAQRSLR